MSVTDLRHTAAGDTPAPSARCARLRALGSSEEDALFLVYGIVPGPSEALALDASVRDILAASAP